MRLAVVRVLLLAGVALLAAGCGSGATAAHSREPAAGQTGPVLNRRAYLASGNRDCRVAARLTRSHTDDLVSRFAAIERGDAFLAHQLLALRGPAQLTSTVARAAGMIASLLPDERRIVADTYAAVHGSAPINAMVARDTPLMDHADALHDA